jgi:hypothetical protein
MPFKSIVSDLFGYDAHNPRTPTRQHVPIKSHPIYSVEARWRRPPTKAGGVEKRPGGLAG